jgi:hypothetical protein
VRAKQREGVLQPRNINISFNNNSNANVYGKDIMHIDNVYEGIKTKGKSHYIHHLTHMTQIFFNIIFSNKNVWNNKTMFSNNDR